MIGKLVAALIVVLFVPFSAHAMPKLEQLLKREVIPVSQTVNHCHKICASLRGSAYRECRAPCDAGNTPAAHRKAGCVSECADRVPGARIVCQKRCESERRRRDF